MTVRKSKKSLQTNKFTENKCQERKAPFLIICQSVAKIPVSFPIPAPVLGKRIADVEISDYLRFFANCAPKTKTHKTVA